MTPNNATVFNCSLKKYNQLLRVYGTGNMAQLNLLKLIYKYSCYSPTAATLQRLDAMVSYLQSSDTTICMDSLNENFFPGGTPAENVTPIPGEKKNRPPSVNNNTIVLADPNDGGIVIRADEAGPQYTKMYTFSIADFTVNFSDPDGDSYGNVMVASIPSQGFLLYNGQEVEAGQLILDASLLEYWILYSETLDIDTTFYFNISDDVIDNPAWSNQAAIILNKDKETGTNQSATVGDNSIYADNLATTVLLPSMFTDGNPAYSDPENDPLDAIRIDRIGTSNQGAYNYNGVAVAVGQVITSAELTAGLFVHVGASTNSVSSDVIDFSVRDTGSLIWVN